MNVHQLMDSSPTCLPYQTFLALDSHFHKNQRSTYPFKRGGAPDSSKEIRFDKDHSIINNGISVRHRRWQ